MRFARCCCEKTRRGVASDGQFEFGESADGGDSRRSSEGRRRGRGRMLRAAMPESTGRLALTPALASCRCAGRGLISTPAFLFLSPPSSSNNPSTSLVIASRSSTHAALPSHVSRMRDESPRARTSRAASPGESTARRVDRLDCVDIELCSSVLDISRACTLRARRESRYGSGGGSGSLVRGLGWKDGLRLCVGRKRFWRRGEVVWGRTGDVGVCGT